MYRSRSKKKRRDTPLKFLTLDLSPTAREQFFGAKPYVDQEYSYKRHAGIADGRGPDCRI